MTLTCVRRLLNLDVDVWIHLNCALWSLEVYETLNGALMNVEAAVKRGKTVVREQLYVQPAHSSALLSSIFILHLSVLRSLLSFSSLSYAFIFSLLCSLLSPMLFSSVFYFCSPLLLFSFHFSLALLFSSEFFR